MALCRVLVTNKMVLICYIDNLLRKVHLLQQVDRGVRLPLDAAV